MSNFIHNLLFVNIGIALVIIIFIALRYVFKNKAHTNILCLIWTVIFLRMLVPIPIESSLSLLDISFVSDVESVNEINTYAVFENSLDTETVGFTEDFSIEDNQVQQTSRTVSDKRIKNTEFTLLYAGGIIVISIFMLVTNILFSIKIKKHSAEIQLDDNEKYIFSNQSIKPLKVYTLEGLQSPCLHEVIKPKILLDNKSAINKKERQYSIYHEVTHYRHKDNLIFLLGIIACIINWFNPLIWIALSLFKNDREIHCDEQVIRQIGENRAVEYGKSLLLIALNKDSKLPIISTTMAGGKKGMHQRIKNIAEKSKRVMFISGIIVVVIITLFITIGTIKSENRIVRTYETERIINLDENPEYVEYFNESRDLSNIVINEIYRADINDDGVDEVYANSGSKSGLSSPDFVECYDLKTGKYSRTEENDEWHYKMIKYNDKLYIFSLNEYLLSDREAYRVYEPAIELGKLNYNEIDSDLQNEIISLVENTISVGIYGNADGPIAIFSPEDIVDISIYDTSSGEDVLLYSYTQEDAEIVKEYIPLYSEFIDTQTTQHPFKAIININKEGVKHIDILWFGNTGYIKMYIGRWKNDEMLDYLNKLAKVDEDG